MIVTNPANPADTGPQSLQLAAQAEKLEAVLWEQVLSCMTRSALPSGSLGVGADLYNGLVTRAMASSMFGGTDSGLTQELVGQLKAEVPGEAPETGATLHALTAMPQVQKATGPSPAQLDRALSFARSVWPGIKTTAAKLGVPPVALLAQSALETGWGASTPGNNLFGIKAVAGQTGNREPTTEEVNGALRATTDNFAAYGSGDGCLAHYASLIRRAYPQATGAASVAQYADALVQGGYATDSGYAQKIVDTAQSPLMRSVLQAVEGDT